MNDTQQPSKELTLRFQEGRDNAIKDREEMKSERVLGSLVDQDGWIVARIWCDWGDVDTSEAEARAVAQQIVAAVNGASNEPLAEIVCSICGEKRAKPDDYCPGCEAEDAARASQPPAPEWQPIETAPKDGTNILICGGTFDSDDESYGDMPYPGVSVAYWDQRRLSPHWHGETRDAHDSWFVHKPTHWMPVPLPYSTATKPAEQP